MLLTKIQLITKATLAGLVVMISLAALWNFVIMPEGQPLAQGVFLNKIYYFGMLTFGYLSLTLLMLAIYSISAWNFSPILVGFITGVLAGVTCIVVLDIVNIPFLHYESFEKYLVNVSWHAVEQGTGGSVIAAIYSKVKFF